jgi:5-methylcytosine-specific restriction endonuclease McrA
MIYQPYPFKRCTKCDAEYLPTAEFFARSHNRLDSRCKRCAAANTRKYYQEHSKERREYTKQWQQAHPEKTQEYRQTEIESGKKKAHRKAHYRQNRHRYISDAKIWRDANPERVRRSSRIASRNYRARVRQAPGTHTDADVQRQYKAQCGKCHWCGCEVGDMYHVDHVIPLFRGGSNGPENLVIACPPCNWSKGDKLPHEFNDRPL